MRFGVQRVNLESTHTHSYLIKYKYSEIMSESAGGSSSSGSGSRPSINLSKMIRLDEVEDILSGMMQRLDSQEATIGSLQRLVGQLLPKAAANEAFENMNESMRDIVKRLNDVSAAATANLGINRDMPAGELAYMNYLNLQQLSTQVAACARQEETLVAMKQLQDDTDAGLMRIRSQCTPAELGESLRRAQLDISKRVTTAESSMATKVDRSEVGMLTTLAAALESYSGFRTNTETILEQQKQWNVSTKSQVDANSAQIVQASKERNLIREQAKLYSTCEQLEEVAVALRSVTGMTNLCAAKKTVNELYEIVRQEQERSSRVEQYARVLTQRIEEADSRIATKASIEDNKKCVLRRHYDEAVTALGKDLNNKATLTCLDQTDTRVTLLEAEAEKEKARLSVAMRFVDWFTSRGENYEHNLRLVDKHLGKLTQAADPKFRSPFESSQIRYSPDVLQKETTQSQFGGSRAASTDNRNRAATSNIGTSFTHTL